ncbi:MAG: hypothetical protein ACKO6K_09475, partial [Chitinophagaceae bacterium]
MSSNTGTIQWQSSTDGTNYSNITGATTSPYTTAALTATTYFRAVVTSGTCASATSSPVTVTVNPTSVAGTAAGDTTMCSGGNQTLRLSGNVGTIQWQSATLNGTFSNITGATSSTLAITNLTVSTRYRAVVTSGVCPSATSNTVTITIDSASVAGTISGASQIWKDSSTTLTLIGYRGAIQWQFSTD